MYEYKRIVRMADSDISGWIYFANVQMIALEAFEDFLHKSGYCLDMIIREGDYLFPIVHTEADYLSAIRVGDELNVQMKVSHIGSSSFSFKYSIFSLRTDMAVATVGITHVFMDKETETSAPVPPEIISLLQTQM